MIPSFVSDRRSVRAFAADPVPRAMVEALVGAACLAPASYVASQALAATLLDAGSLGVVYPSVRRDGGTCLACFRPAMVTHVRRAGTWRFTWTAGTGPRIEPESARKASGTRSTRRR